ncbi:SDR family oxidoreductase [Microbacterium sp. CFH 31415]|uniref:SDR family NAD(P)-dependent oxidoreductase n=1 Tax=Microbacterium sp. CFH 31415 TaxID=2921732 RepID=UPI001F135E80|nr:SDR family oxidoreductase [Microbacterium sp. CFH 31415]MCH6231608.1 SDR family oxidoreductase [Microbacterium sp. CFH 31415]
MMSSGSHVVVTGGASGIGAEVVGELLSRGCAVSVLDLQGGSPRDADVFEVDVVDECAVGEAMDAAAVRSGPITGLVACAGIRGEFVPALELDLDRARRVLEINVLGTLVPARAMVTRLDGRAASIVAVSSTTAYGGWANQSDYGPSKAAVRQLVMNLAVEWAPLGVRVNAVAPGHTLTPMIVDMVEKGYDLGPVKARMPLGRLAEPAEQAREIAHLLLDATFTTGQCVAVDGGWTAVGK